MSAKRNSKGISAQLHSAHLAAQLFHRKMLLKVLCTFRTYHGKAVLLGAIKKISNH